MAWKELFLKKYGQTTLYILEADELAADEFGRRLAATLSTESLFAEPKLVIVKRLTAQEKGKSLPFSQGFLGVLTGYLKNLDNKITVAVWEENSLPATHPLRQAFQVWQSAGEAKIQHFQVPATREVGRVIQSLLQKEDFSIEPDARQWLVEQYGRIEQINRLAQRLKTNEELMEDERSWWLHQVLAGAMLRATKKSIHLSDLANEQVIQVPVGPFDLINALSRRNWLQAREIARLMEAATQDEAGYFNLYAALRWHFRRGLRNSEEARFALTLLAEIELVTKNFSLEHAWLVDSFINRLEEASRGSIRPIFRQRVLWLSQLPRSA